jgi:tRNA pseudouridine55 synthase
MTLANPKLNIDGILLVNKPYGLTSNAVLQQAKRLFRAKKAGHTGSLDPMATGMLPICFGEATKICQYLLDADKCYEATGLLGVKTNTGDAMGEVIARTEFFTVSVNDLEAILSLFRGEIKQVPSMFSALKHQGTPLYKYARAGVEIDRPARDVTIHDLQLNQFDGKQFAITVTCSKGTYIRNLVEDIGEQLGVGAHVTRLHRLYTAGLADEPMFTMDDLQTMSAEQLSSILLPMDRAVNYMPRVAVNRDEAQALQQGKTVYSKVVGDVSGCVRLYENDVHFMGLGDLDATGILKVKRLLNGDILRSVTI